MELYLDSVKIDEIKEANKLGFIAGLTTTPTFMYRDGIKDIDKAILEIAGMVNILQVEALGATADEIVKEAHRQVQMGLDPKRTVFKIPISLEGTKACYRLRSEGLMVNMHLVYTLQQAYMALSAGATYVCPLVGRLQDQGHDALGLVEQCVEVVETYGYDSKIMFSSVRHVEHVKNALNIGVHTCTIPWKVMKQLTENHFTDIGTKEFFHHTALLTTRVSDVMRKDDIFLSAEHTVLEALIQMSKSKVGAVIVTNATGGLHRIFTDGDLRRLLQEGAQNIQGMKLADLPGNTPASVDVDAALIDAQQLFASLKIDNLVVTDGDQPVGILDIQDVVQ